MQKNSISDACVLIIDEMYLQKAVQYHNEKSFLVGQDKEGNLYKSIVNFMIVSLKQSIPVVKKSCAETTVSRK